MPLADIIRFHSPANLKVFLRAGFRVDEHIKRKPEILMNRSRGVGIVVALGGCFLPEGRFSNKNQKKKKKILKKFFKLRGISVYVYRCLCVCETWHNLLLHGTPLQFRSQTGLWL